MPMEYEGIEMSIDVVAHMHEMNHNPHTVMQIMKCLYTAHMNTNV